MTVAELIDELQKLPAGSLIVQSSDTEGNSYSPTFQLSPGHYAAEEGEDRGDFGEADDFPDLPHVPAVCLFPRD